MPARSCAPAPMCWSRARPCSRAAPEPTNPTSRRSAARRRRCAAKSREATATVATTVAATAVASRLLRRPGSGRARAMIPRYSRPEMAAIWEAQTRYRIWFEIEAHATDALAALGIVPKEAAQAIWAKGKNAKFDIARIDEIEREVKHDVIAFLTHLAEIVGPQARFVHQGMTSSDVLDTCLNVQLVRAADILIGGVDKVRSALKRRAFEHKMTPTIGRSHGIHAEPVTFGLKLAFAYAEFTRARERLIIARKEVATCAISGAVDRKSTRLNS